MPVPNTAFQESGQSGTCIRDLGLKIAGTRLEPIIAEFQAELIAAGITRVRPHFYLSTEWGVPFPSVAIAIPFYLVNDELTRFHERQTGHVEGTGRADVLRYLRHEMGHVINYAYRLYEEEEWIKRFGSMTQPYLEEYRPQPFSRRFVLHLPGWYAQKHPDEDWAETFAVWLTPGLDWQAEYARWPEALAKLDYCARTLKALADRDPVELGEDPGDDLADMTCSVHEYFGTVAPGSAEPLPAGLDGALKTIFEDLGRWEDLSSTAPRRPAAPLIRRLEHDLLANVYRWTGHFPEHARPLIRHLAERAEQLNQVYPEDREATAIVAVTTLVTALAMSHVHQGSYLP